MSQTYINEVKENIDLKLEKQMKTNEIEKLEQEIRHHNQLYADGNPVISDSEYDLLVEELKKICPASPVLMEVGSVPSYGTKIKHSIVMGSLQKINTIGELKKWYNEHPDDTVWSWKIDGCAGEIVYKNGILTSASTRGDGVNGMLITDNVKNISSIPTQLDRPLDLTIRGEFYIPKEFFNKNLSTSFANARNCVASSLMIKDSSKTSERGIEFMVYRVMNMEFGDLTSEANFINSLIGKNGSTINSLRYVSLTKETIDDVALLRIENFRSVQRFESDGIVISVNNNFKREEYGYLNDKYPKGSIAYKFKPEQVTTKILDIEWNACRTGKVVPIAILNPVKLAGSTISKTMLHNWSEIQRLGIKCVNQEVVIQKSGDIIPQILYAKHIVEDGKIFQKPDKCPACGSYLEFDGINIWCINNDCKNKLVYQICNWLKVLDIKEIGEGIISDLCDRGMIKKLSDIYYVDHQELANLPGYGFRSAEIYADAILSVVEVDLWKFLAALGISGIGIGTAKLLAKRYQSLDKIQNEMSKEELLKIDGISNITADEIMNGIKNNFDVITEMSNIIKIINQEQKSGIFVGKKFCCTGELSIKRKEIQKMIEDRGGEYTSIKKGMDYLLIGDGAVQAKIDKAIKLGATILTEQEFMDKINK